MKFAIIASVAALAVMLPATAQACHHVSERGSFNVSCENGVQVFRHNTPALPRLSPAAQSRLEAARIAQQTARENNAAKDRRAAVANKLKQQELDLEKRKQQRRTGRYGNASFGLSFAQPIIVGSPAPRARRARRVARKH